MACTVNTTATSAAQTPDGRYIVSGKASPDSAYATGGEVLDLSAYVGAHATFVCVANTGDPTNYKAHHDLGTASAGKVLVFHSGNGAQIAANTDVSALVITFQAYSEQAP